MKTSASAAPVDSIDMMVNFWLRLDLEKLLGESAGFMAWQVRLMHEAHEAPAASRAHGCRMQYRNATIAGVRLYARDAPYDFVNRMRGPAVRELI
jgi:hypothetical protein